jgi:hypothetical protein
MDADDEDTLRNRVSRVLNGELVGEFATGDADWIERVVQFTAKVNR